MLHLTIHIVVVLLAFSDVKGFRRSAFLKRKTKLDQVLIRSRIQSLSPSAQYDDELNDPRILFDVPRGGMQRDVLTWRLFAVVAIAVVGTKLHTLDLLVHRLWQILQHRSWFRHDMFEPVLSVLSFGVWIHGWLLVDSLVLHPKSPPFLQNMRKLRLQDQHYVGRKAKNLLRTGNEVNNSKSARFEPSTTVTIEMRSSSSDLPVRSLPTATRWYSTWVVEMMLYLAPLWAIAEFLPRAFAPRRIALAWKAPTFLTLVSQVLGGIFLYDFFFFFSHFLMHKAPPKVYKFLHSKHHQNVEVRAADTVRLTAIEETVDVICSIAALRVLRAHPLSRAIYDMIITFLLVELHCGYDMPWAPQNLVPSLFAGSKRHHQHHRRGDVYFQKFFRYFDDLLLKFNIMNPANVEPEYSV